MLRESMFNEDPTSKKTDKRHSVVQQIIVLPQFFSKEAVLRRSTCLLRRHSKGSCGCMFNKGFAALTLSQLLTLVDALPRKRNIGNKLKYIKVLTASTIISFLYQLSDLRSQLSDLKKLICSFLQFKQTGIILLFMSFFFNFATQIFLMLVIETKGKLIEQQKDLCFRTFLKISPFL